jgi:hypothetical protein
MFVMLCLSRGRRLIWRRNECFLEGGMLLGGDCEYARKDADVPGRMNAEFSLTAGVFGGRNAASRNINLRAAILSGDTMMVRLLSAVHDGACDAISGQAH